MGGTTTATTEFAQDGWKTHLDALGQVMAQMGNENWDTWADLDGSNNLQTRYLRGDVVDQLFGREDSAGNVFWTLTDRLGSIRTVMDNSANVKDQISYDGWGNPTGTNSFAGRYLWTGRDYDTETNLQYNRARTYDPHTGRWLSQDPLGFDAGDSNLYRYVNNKPMILVDLSGFKPHSNIENLKKYQKDLDSALKNIKTIDRDLREAYENFNKAFDSGRLALAGQYKSEIYKLNDRRGAIFNSITQLEREVGHYWFLVNRVGRPQPTDEREWQKFWDEMYKREEEERKKKKFDQWNNEGKYKLFFEKQQQQQKGGSK